MGLFRSVGTIVLPGYDRGSLYCLELKLEGLKDYVILVLNEGNTVFSAWDLILRMI